MVDTIKIVGLSNYVIKKISTELESKWKRDIKGKGKLSRGGDENALNVNDGKPKWKNNFKKNFKGVCCKCGQIGHKAVDCYSKKVTGADSGETSEYCRTS